MATTKKTTSKRLTPKQVVSVRETLAKTIEKLDKLKDIKNLRDEDRVRLAYAATQVRMAKRAFSEW